ncbi:formylmethanofuran dehydrogenase subunit A [Methanoregula formicica]|uniref:Formylmethanofuran dehydrogenase subunit A n=1 Tax=Methanoregula formicica (strain DSM 22288 / NBRC 105244 / SMSP) TaxID=593750 RepID=L0HD66_METFS|nr:formylmethanofuran dehydrogenase subunit A [Methanoregula formicica]AGB01716.1 formylmethanofuran dehydrogenase subunit A [Methanoregula formicica SMSP]
MSSGEIIVKGGFIVDPTRKINGDVGDVAIKDGKIVDRVGSSAKVIDAKGKVVMAGGVDIHSHVAGPKVNAGRLMRPEDKLRSGDLRSGVAQKNGYRMESGFSIPSTFRTGYEYARMGYSFVMEAAMPPLLAPHTHEEIHDTPIIDEAALPVFGNNWFVMEYLRNNEIENTAAYIAWLLKTTKGYGVKVVNPGGTAAWAWGLNCLSINDPVPYFEITPAEIMTGLMKANEYLGLPHSMHVHQNDLGNPGNFQVTLDSLKLAEGIKAKNKFGREQVMHSTHLQFHSYGGDGWGTFCSKAKEVMDYVNKTKNITIDLGCVTLDETTTMTADGPFEHHLHGLNHLKWTNVDVEMETAAGIVPYVYDPNIKVCDIQWAIGLELALYAKDMDRTFITTDHPNAGPFTRYPRVIKWLMSKKARDATLDSFKHKDKVLDAISLHNIKRELSLFEIAQMTRSGPAKALGLAHMYGGLAPGMSADVAVYDLNVKDMPKDPEEIEDAFLRAACFIKSGEVVVKDGEVVSNGHKKTVWVNAKMPENPQVTRDVTEAFTKGTYTMDIRNYPVRDYLAPHPFVIEYDVEA